MRKRMGTVALLSVAGAALAWVSTTETKNGQRQISIVPGNQNQTSLIAGKSLLVAAGTERAAASTIGCQSTSSRYPWGSAAFRTWTPLNVGKSAGTPGSYDTSGTRTGSPFSARLIQAHGQDVGESRQSVVLEMPDGCRRQFRSSSFIAADVSFIRAEIDNHPSTSDPNSYAVSVAEQNLVSLDEIRSGAVRTYQTQHFNIMYGTKTRNFSYRHEASLNVPWNTFIAEVGRSFESAWQIDRLILEAPMPYSGSSGRKKINIYICGTGMPFIENGDDTGCGASGADGIFVDAPSVQEGSLTAIHEFGHAIQFYSGGFRDRASAGPIWETGAEWTAFTQSQTEEYFLVGYLSNLENGPLWSNNRYGSFPFMSFLFEQDKTRPFLWSGWTGNLRDGAGASKEDWTETFIRQAQAAGVYPSGYASFADDMGWYGARLVAMDFLHQQALTDIRNSDLAGNVYTSLRANGAGNYASSTARPLRQWGSHLIPLTVNGSQVSVTLKGATTGSSAAWRTMLVSVGADGTPRYSTMGKITGTGSATITLGVAKHEKMYLVVTATPGAYQSLGWQPEKGAVTGAAFPYAVRMTGATALSTPATKCTSVIEGVDGMNLNYNTNGRVESNVPCT